jgi:hypothetical protein
MSGWCRMLGDWKSALVRLRQTIRKIKTGYEIGYEMNMKNQITSIRKACSEQLRFNV